MDKKETTGVKNLDPKKRNIAIVATLLAVIVVAILLFQFMKPERSVISYCKVYKEEKGRLAKLPGDTWPSAVFNDQVGDANELAISFQRLENVAPNEIQSDVITLQKLYKKISDDPSQAVNASLSGLGAEDAVKDWTSSNCKQ